MTEMDALRLRVAARAYRATRPDDAEVERGVRRTLSAMRRSQINRRRAGLTPAIIVAILAFGTLAYANPNSVRRWVSALLLSTRESVSEQVTQQVNALRAERLPAPASEAPVAPSPPARLSPEQASGPDPSTATPAAAQAVEPLRSASHKAPRAARAQRATWAEVNSALAGQDTPRALAALGDLSRHGDAATRAKAELGIAQLLWSRGDRATACNIARRLEQQKSTPQRVQERARALGQGCEK